MILKSNSSKKLAQLALYETELKKFTKKLEKVVLKVDKRDLIRVEHFQNQFLIQQNNINRLKREVRTVTKRLSKNTTLNNQIVNNKYTQVLSQKMKVLQQIFEDLTREFRSFFRKLLSSFFSYQMLITTNR